ncbi:adenylate/guanylate cyclase domain-containing protein [Terrimonas pollutisoli]|uniref:adenylate/guanylate cyclase domain-containing protein n=1 Tax=Terrimonas pollutisoli TaxID=3034147 RepID=UPI0034DF6CEB
MESHGISGEIQVTESTFKLLENKCSVDCRGTIDVKGKGLMTTYILKGNKIHVDQEL